MSDEPRTPPLRRPCRTRITTKKVGRWRWDAYLFVGCASHRRYGAWSEEAAGRKALRGLRRHERTHGQPEREWWSA